jgi:hypothetical protein
MALARFLVLFVQAISRWAVLGQSRNHGWLVSGSLRRDQRLSILAEAKPHADDPLARLAAMLAGPGPGYHRPSLLVAAAGGLKSGRDSPKLGLT